MQFCTIPLRFMLTQPWQSRSCNPRCALNSMCSFDLRCPRMALRRKEPEHPRVLFTPLQNATPACFRKRIYARETNDQFRTGVGFGAALRARVSRNHRARRPRQTVLVHLIHVSTIACLHEFKFIDSAFVGCGSGQCRDADNRSSSGASSTSTRAWVNYSNHASAGSNFSSANFTSNRTLLAPARSSMTPSATGRTALPAQSNKFMAPPMMVSAASGAPARRVIQNHFGKGRSRVQYAE